MYNDIPSHTALNEAEYKLEFELTKDGMSIVRMLENIDGVIMAPHCIRLCKNALLHNQT